MTSVKLEGLGPVLARLRRDKGLSNADLAAKAGVTPAMLSRYENSRVVPREKTLDRLLSAMNAGPADLDQARLRLAFEEAGAPGESSWLSTLLSGDLERLLEDPACRSSLIDVLTAVGRFYGAAAAALRHTEE